MEPQFLGFGCAVDKRVWAKAFINHLWPNVCSILKIHFKYVKRIGAKTEEIPCSICLNESHFLTAL